MSAGDNTRMGNSDIGLLNSKIPNQYTSMSSEKEVFTKADMAYKTNQFNKTSGKDDVDISNYNTPDYLLKGGGRAEQDLAKDIMDIEVGNKARRPFTRDDFRLMINSTYTEYYGKFRDQYNPDEYMQCVDDEELVKRFGAFLEQSEDNMLTRENMPWLDLGDIPSTHSFMRSES